MRMSSIFVRREGVWIPALSKDLHIASFGFVGHPQSWSVPLNVDRVYVICAGGSGGAWNYPTNPLSVAAKGAIVGMELEVEFGDEIGIYVGGMGDDFVSGVSGTSFGGWNGGGNSTINGSGWTSGSGGGGATDIRMGGDSLLDRVLVAGGGGGIAANGSNINVKLVLGGEAGLESGENGSSSSDATGYGYGGTQSAGGAAGIRSVPGQAGTLGQGGDGGTAQRAGGGGGGGYYGGGGGGGHASTNSSAHGGGGGGGSSYPLDAEFLGYNRGDGWCKIFWGDATV